MPPFFGNATVAPTAWARVKKFYARAPGATVLTIFGTAAANTPGGQYEFDIGNGYIKRISHAANLTCDISLAGPIIGGRDQAGAFAINSWVYLYAILNTADLASVAFVFSANQPSVGPNAVTGYQSPLFCGAYRVTATSNIQFGHRRNNTWTYTNQPPTIVSTATAPTAEQTADISGQVPPTAYEFTVDADTSQAGTTVVGVDIRLLFKVEAATAFSEQTNRTQVANQSVQNTSRMILPYVGTNLFWNWFTTGTVAGTLNTFWGIDTYSEALT